MTFDGTLPEPTENEVSPQPDGFVDKRTAKFRDLFFMFLTALGSVVAAFAAEWLTDNTDTIVSEFPATFTPVAGFVLTALIAGLTGITRAWGRGSK